MEYTFESAIEEIRKNEKKAVKYAPYNGETVISENLDIEPEEFVGISYENLLNTYEKSQKIISTSRLGISSAGYIPEAEKSQEVQSEQSKQIETKLKELTGETLHTAQQVAKEPEMEIKLEKDEQPAVPEILKTEEIKPPETEMPKESQLQEPTKIESRKPPPQPATVPLQPPETIRKSTSEKIGTPALEIPTQKPTQPTVPQVLQENPEETENGKYEQIENEIGIILGGATDELTIKKKMFELTKELFREKTVGKREQIKLQITVLKNMLVGATRPKTTGNVTAVPVLNFNAGLFETILTEQQNELVKAKDGFMARIHAEIEGTKSKFYGQLEKTESTDEKKKLFEEFVVEIARLIERLPSDIACEEEKIETKHAAQLRKLVESNDGAKGIQSKINDKIANIGSRYKDEFSNLKIIVAKEIDGLIDSASSEMFGGTSGTDSYEMMEMNQVKTINGLADGTLLNYLKMNNPEIYDGYEKKKISKTDAIAKAKELMARERKLSQKTIDKYFRSENLGE